jgi:hypothetical protein
MHETVRPVGEHSATGYRLALWRHGFLGTSVPSNPFRSIQALIRFRGSQGRPDPLAGWRARP